MTEERRSARRPGGRSARVREALHQAVSEMVTERGYGNFTVGDVAARAGVADTSVYRRWGNLEALLADVLATRLAVQSPIPDTGSLAGDLRAYAANVAHAISGPDGLAVLSLVVALSGAGQDGKQARDAFLAERARQLQVMLGRARQRGESAPDTADVLDQILAPMYIRTLFQAGSLTPEYIDRLVDRVLLSAPSKEPPDKGPSRRL